MTCDVALAAARQHGLSAALFAPGWVYENHDRADWQQLQGSFWSKIEDAWPASQAPITRLPLHTCFSTGCGQRMYLAGHAVAGSGPWFNLSAQQRLPHEQLLQQPWVLQVTTGAAGEAAPAPGCSTSSSVVLCVEEAACAAAGLELSAAVTDTAAYEGGTCLALSCCSTSTQSTSTQSSTDAGSLQLACCKLFDLDVCPSKGRLQVSCTAGGAHPSSLVLLLTTSAAAAAAASAKAPCQHVFILAPAASTARLQGQQGLLQGQQVTYSVVQASCEGTVGACDDVRRLCLAAEGQEQGQGGGRGCSGQWQQCRYQVELPEAAPCITGCAAGLLMDQQACSTAVQVSALLGEWCSV
jgi:hypothetical protein